MRLAWAVFTRAARVGEVKSRLAARYGPQAALLVHRWLLRRTLATVGTVADEHVLWTASEADPWTRRLARGRGWTLRLQEGEDLGARMAHAVERHLAAHEAVVLVGGDLPGLETGTLRAMAEILLDARSPIVFLPAHDGGYGALGLRRPSSALLEALFVGIPWGTSSVLERSLRALRARGCTPVLLPPITDWDRPEDIAALSPVLPRSLVRRLVVAGDDGAAAPRVKRDRPVMAVEKR